ncbi:sigma-70 family RNA polymerase sigma factor [Adhaeretor mobilis]|uniref:ECF RNA polymerase sigma factor SigD n=1 Tax=Adhaeretor mobilis TaxID=1930276 RepID=A0A517MZM2_9BACT|nr:sigma-70 family RNA polymerase sigma factor [Adhaeretor mobilis]QDT00336.1 ECF RNA polymerase sigma factor SigD [Adhaeretor mobilis]
MSVPTENDHTALIEQIRLGDSAAMAEYVERKRAQLLAFIQSRIGGPLRKKIEPEDILQDASLEAVKSLDKIDLSERDPINWVFQICERKIIDAHRRHFASQKRDASREAVLPEGSQGGGGIANLLIASMTTPSEAFSRDQRQLRMLAALDTLPEEQREALRLRYLVGLPSKEIAAKMGKSDGAMRVMLSRSLAKLQDMLVD